MTRIGARPGGKGRAILTLVLLSPAVAELMSGSTPPPQLLNPAVPALLLGLYGAGALLAREAWVRWGGGPASLLLLGAAYGVFEEGVVTRSFFCPTFHDLGPMEGYGRWLGVNWVWTGDLTLFHSVFSVTVPVGLTELLHPGARGRPLVGRRGTSAAVVSLAAVTLVGLVGFRCSEPVGAVHVVAAALASACLAWAARAAARGPEIRAGREEKKEEGGEGLSTRVRVGWAAWTVAAVLGPFLMARVGIPAALAAAAEAAAAWVAVRWALGRRWSAGPAAWDAATSPLWGLILLDVAEAAREPTMLLVALAAAAALAVGGRAIRRR